MSFSAKWVCLCAIALPVTGAFGQIYGIKSNAPTTGQPSAAPARLFSLNADGTGFTDLGLITVPGAGQIDADGLAISPNHGLLAYSVTPNGSGLMSLNPLDAVGTPIGGFLAGRQIRGAVFDLADRLWALDSSANQILRMNPLTGDVLSSVALSEGGGAFNLFDSSDIAIRSTGQMVLASGDSFYSINPFTGAVDFLGNHPANALAGITFSGDAQEDRLFGYEVNGTDDIFTYDIDTSFSPSLLIGNILPSFNAGRGDLASIVIPAPGTMLLLGAAGIGLRRRRVTG